jgi:hypothetical protein
LQRAPLDHPLKSNESANSVVNIAERKINTNLNGWQANPTGQPNSTSAVKHPMQHMQQLDENVGNEVARKVSETSKPASGHMPAGEA